MHSHAATDGAAGFHSAHARMQVPAQVCAACERDQNGSPKWQKRVRSRSSFWRYTRDIHTLFPSSRLSSSVSRPSSKTHRLLSRRVAYNLINALAMRVGDRKHVRRPVRHICASRYMNATTHAQQPYTPDAPPRHVCRLQEITRR
jgi:hypothetical protein